MKLPETRWYEIHGDAKASRAGAWDRLVRDITAATTLGIDFTVRTVSMKAFRNGGNMSKSDVLGFELTLGETTTRENT